ncbi:stalk domain-containing protein [Paenibacillus sp.]|jgi:hypothetical protein|uniref:stalk domain-containing protein n=1 Tax=Paenibacillus sp. TaxID=58172 RepID=UPI00282C3801|nr:stalk domain-containing protein [Paenibacillus sp.]MDR0267258.1 copper amine oxidase N-terminal domain-containing protein [Paenibacillus sp.]
MKNKFIKSVAIVLFIALVSAWLPFTLANADKKDDKKKEHYEQTEHEYDEEEYDKKERNEKDSEKHRKEGRYEEPAQTPITITPTTSAQFADKEEVTFSFAEGGSFHDVVRVKQGELFIPLNSVLQALNEPFVIYPKESILEGFADGKQFIFNIGTQIAYINGQRQNIIAAPFVESNQFYVPLEVAADIIGRIAVANPQEQTIEFK